MTIDTLARATELLENIQEAQTNLQYISEARTTLANSLSGVFVNSNVDEGLQHTVVLPSEIVSTLLDIAEQYYTGLTEQCKTEFEGL